jgi:hypothetical protein
VYIYCVYVIRALVGQWVGLHDNSYRPITNTTWVCARLSKLQKGCTRLAATSDKVCQLLAHYRCFSHGTLTSSTTKTGRHDVAEILLKVTLNTINQINQIYVIQKLWSVWYLLYKRKLMFLMNYYTISILHSTSYCTKWSTVIVLLHLVFPVFILCTLVNF